MIYKELSQSVMELEFLKYFVVKDVINLNIYVQGPWAQKFIICPYIGPVAQAENRDLSEEEKSSLEEITLINKRWGLVIIAPESVPRMKTSSTKLGRGPGRWFDSKDDNPGNSVGADKHCRDI